MLIIFSFTLVFLFTYAVLINFYEKAWNTMPFHHFTKSTLDSEWKKISVIIPARNEEKNIIHCLNALAAQSYPAALIEIIVVNDYSTDKTETLVRNFKAENIRLINLEDILGTHIINSYKKKAIEAGIEASSGEIIITTDADCAAGAQWIECMVHFQMVTNAAFIAAPVKIVFNRTFLGLFQSLDFLTLQGITGASVFKKVHSMCNGANLAYLRKVFFEVEGFKGIDTIASGDDMLLMHKIANKYPDRYFFLKNPAAIVQTLPASSWKEFFNQRIRWASKAGLYDDRRITIVLVLVYLLNFLLIVFLVLSLINPLYLFCFLLLVISKTFIEFEFVQQVASFFRQTFLMRYFFILQPFHIIYTVITGFLGKFGSYEWKSRKVN